MLQSGVGFIGHSQASSYENGKLEKLQIEGTVRNVDESGLDHEKIKFSNYWARLNWGPRNGWTEESKKNQGNRYELKEPLDTNYEAGLFSKRSRYAAEALQDSEVELIDSSKVSDELANLRFMRLEKKMKKDI